MKRLLPLFLVLLFLFNSIGYFFVFSINQLLIRREMHAMIRTRYYKESSLVTVLHPSTNQQYRRVDDHEFIYNGVLYDIVSEKSVEGGVTFTCIPDTKEQQLITSFSHSSDYQTGQANPARVKLTRALLQLVVTTAMVNKTPTIPPTCVIDLSFLNQSSQLISGFERSMFHPPQEG